MLEYSGVTPLEQGCAIIEKYFSDGYQEIHSLVAESVETFVEGLPYEPDDVFDTVAQNVITGIDRAKAFRTRSLQVAKRTFAVSKLVMCVAFDHEPSFDVGKAVGEYMRYDGPVEYSFIRMCNSLRQSFYKSKGFGTIMSECQPSIDPLADEPDIFPVIAGLALQSAAFAEAGRAREELEASAAQFSVFDGDLWDLFEQ